MRLMCCKHFLPSKYIKLKTKIIELSHRRLIEDMESRTLYNIKENQPLIAMSLECHEASFPPCSIGLYISFDIMYGEYRAL